MESFEKLAVDMPNDNTDRYYYYYYYYR